jgi:hypothetical protein
MKTKNILTGFQDFANVFVSSIEALVFSVTNEARLSISLIAA